MEAASDLQKGPSGLTTSCSRLHPRAWELDEAQVQLSGNQLGFGLTMNS
jgi:hypothetical protein